MNTYYTIKMYTDFWIPLVLVGALLVVIIIRSTLESFKAARINRFFIEHGYERKLLGVAAFGNGRFYGWRRECGDKVTIVDDRDIKHKSFREIKEQYDDKSEG